MRSVIYLLLATNAIAKGYNIELRNLLFRRAELNNSILFNLTPFKFLILEQILKDNEHFIYYLFNVTAGLLYLLSQITGLSYQFWNILIWFGIIPAICINLIGRKTNAWVNIISLLLFGYLFTIHTWNQWFDKAVVLLNKMSDYFHSDYKSMSVYVCVFIPLIITLGLTRLCLSSRVNKWICIITACICLVIVLLFPISNAVISDFVNFKEVI